MKYVNSALSAVPLIGQLMGWIRKQLGSHLSIKPRPANCYFTQNPDTGTALVVLDLAIENLIGENLWLQSIEVRILINNTWHQGQTWPAETYAFPWARGIQVCQRDQRIDLADRPLIKIPARMPLGGYVLSRFSQVTDDLPRVDCQVTALASRGKPVTTVLSVQRHLNERQRSDVRILAPIELTHNGIRYQYNATDDETTTIPRYVYDTIQTMYFKDSVLLIKHWELE